MLELFSLKGRVAIVTGSASGFGRATAKLFAEAGASVVLASRRTEKLQIVADGIAAMGGQTLVIAADLTLETQVQHLVERSLQCFGQIVLCVQGIQLGDRRGVDGRRWVDGCVMRRAFAGGRLSVGMVSPAYTPGACSACRVSDSLPHFHSCLSRARSRARC
jgi:NAD(P)-dependent dehydrogenase (short-subunit alcohol dehydrogenase family)